MQFVAGVRQLSAQELGVLGVNDVAYVKRVVVDGAVRFAVHAADGSEMAVFADRELAIVTVRHNDMEPVSVH